MYTPVYVIMKNEEIIMTGLIWIYIIIIISSSSSSSSSSNAQDPQEGRKCVVRRWENVAVYIQCII